MNSDMQAMEQKPTAHPDRRQDSEAFQSLFERAKRQVTKWRVRRRRTLSISAGALSLTFVGMVGMMCLDWIHPIRGGIVNIVLLLFVLGLLGGLCGLLVGILMRPLRGNAMNSLWDAQDVRAVGPLVEAVGMLLPEVSEAAVPALIRLLPRLQATEAHLLNTHQRDSLNRILADTVDVAFSTGHHAPLSHSGLHPILGGVADVALLSNSRQLRLAILKAYRQVGDGNALPIVQRLAEGKGSARQDAEMKAAAQECLPFLQERADQDRRAQTYLRAAAAPAASGETLLRAAAGVSETDPQQLLRAGRPDASPHG